jgi:hypothetical protein
MWILFGNACRTDLLLMILLSLDTIGLSCKISYSVAVITTRTYYYIAIDIDNDMNKMLSQTSTHQNSPSLRARSTI